METLNWKIEGMHCSNCALTISRYLEKEGLQNVKVSLVGGDLSFDWNGHTGLKKIHDGIGALGYGIVEEAGPEQKKGPINKHLLYLLVCTPFTALLMIHMLGPAMRMHWIMNGWTQFFLCLPVYALGMNYFGRSAWKSIRNGLPNMNVLIALGSTAAFVYSLTGTILNLGNAYFFYETAAAIICLIFLGNYLEDISVLSTQKALNTLARSQVAMATMIAFDDQHQELLFPVKNNALRVGDLVLVKSGELIPSDAKVLWGEANVDESILSGESLPVAKYPKDPLIGGSLVIDGLLKAQVTSTTKDSILSDIVNLVKRAQGEKPPIQQLADRISAVFVPVVLVIALAVFLINLFFLHELSAALMRSIAVLVIACPCAMGLATPAAIAVGLGRAARRGILFRHAKGLELFCHIRQVVFDKTGTLTTGNFSITSVQVQDQKISLEEFKHLAWSLEKYSNHPIALCISKAWRTQSEIRWTKIEEIKGRGIKGLSSSGEWYWAGSHKIADFAEDGHDVYITKNGDCLGWIDLTDEIRPEAAEVIRFFKGRKIKTILLSGDRMSKCRQSGAQLGIDEVYGEQSPAQKLERIAQMKGGTPTAMVGDGINDAPALAKADIGISMSDASDIARQTSDLVLMNQGLKNLPAAIELGRLTFLTIRQNLFWAFFYNLIAIPVAAFGLLTPTVGALVMGMSDLVLLANSVRLYSRKIN
jgi:P-type Cu+ transporter